MKRALMMLVAVLTLTTVASVQAANVKVEFKNRVAGDKFVPAKNVEYSVANADGAIVVDGAGSDFTFNGDAGKYEITVEQKAGDQVYYGSTVMEVPAVDETFKYEITPTELRLIEEDDDKAAVVIPNEPVVNAAVRPMPCCGMPQACCCMPQAPVATAGYCNNWGILGLTGALVATAIALGVDDDDPQDVSGVQR